MLKELVTNYKFPSGAPLIVIFYLFNLFLTNFGLPLYPAYSFFFYYGLFYLTLHLSVGSGIKISEKKIFFMHLFIIFYLVAMYLFHAAGLIERENIHIWNFNSSLKYLSILIASLVVIVTPMKNIIKSLVIIRNTSYLIIFLAFNHLLLKLFGLNFLTSDFLSGYRFDGGLNSYIMAGQFLLAGFIAHLQLSSKLKFNNFLKILAFFGIAIIATKDRTTILSMIIILTALLFRSGYGVNPFLFKIPKSIILITVMPAILSFFFLQAQIVNSGNIDTYKSTINRVVLAIRSYEIFRESFPLGYGPGSQTYLMYDAKISQSFDEGSEGSVLSSALVKEIKNWEQRAGSSEERNSPHNTYFDILIPFGAVGLLFVICIFAIQFKAFVRLFYLKNSINTVYLDSFFLSSCVFFLFSSLSHIIWLYIIFYRVFLYRSMKNQKIWITAKP